MYHVILTHNGQSVKWAGLRGDRTGHSRSSTMWSPIHEGLYPGPCGIRDGTEAHICMGPCFRGPGTWVGRVVHEQAGQLMAGRAVGDRPMGRVG